MFPDTLSRVNKHIMVVHDHSVSASLSESLKSKSGMKFLAEIQKIHKISHNKGMGQKLNIIGNE